MLFSRKKPSTGTDAHNRAGKDIGIFQHDESTLWLIHIYRDGYEFGSLSVGIPSGLVYGTVVL